MHGPSNTFEFDSLGLPPQELAASMATFDSSGSSGSDDVQSNLSDWVDDQDDEHLRYTCLFSDEAFGSLDEALKVDKQKSGFDFTEYAGQVGVYDATVSLRPNGERHRDMWDSLVALPSDVVTPAIL